MAVTERTVRRDIAKRLQPTGHPVELIDPPDPALLVSGSVATGTYPLYATIRLPVSMEPVADVFVPSI